MLLVEMVNQQASFQGKVIRGKQVCEVKKGIEKISFFDRTVRLFFFKAARFIWALRGKSVKSTILSEG